MLASSNHHHFPPMEICPMEPLFDEDWLHEHNLDTLFDLFEEEVERKGLVETAAATTTNSSAAIFGSSPVTSYLFGTSPPFASALDIYDLLYFDNNQQQPTTQTQQTQSQQAAPDNNTTSLTTSSTTATTRNHSSANSQINPNIQDRRINVAATTKTYNVNGTGTHSNNSIQTNVKQLVSGQNVTTTNSYLANSITNAMRIKRKLKKGQNEGTSLLARPLSNNHHNNNGAGISRNGSNSGDSCSSNFTGGFMNNQNISDKSNTKMIITTTTNSKRPNCNDNFSGTRGIDIKQSHHNRNRHLSHDHYHHNVHHITGLSIIREHAYAVRGH